MNEKTFFLKMKLAEEFGVHPDNVEIDEESGKFRIFVTDNPRARLALRRGGMIITKP